MPVILVVEDDRDQRQAVGSLLTSLFPHVRIVMTESGERGLALAERTRPNCVLLDLRLSGIGGFEFAAALRRLPAGADVPIVALTGDGSPDTLLRAEAAGFVALLRKPADVDRLDRALRPLLDAPGQDPEVSPSSRS